MWLHLQRELEFERTEQAFSPTLRLSDEHGNNFQKQSPFLLFLVEAELTPTGTYPLCLEYCVISELKMAPLHRLVVNRLYVTPFFFLLFPREYRRKVN